MKNAGGVNRTIRIVAGIAIIAWGFYAKSWFGAIGLLPLLTGIVSICPAYLPFGFTTSRTEG